MPTGLTSVIPRLHRVVQPWLSRLRPFVSPIVEALPRRRLTAALNVADIRSCAQARAHRMVFGYLDSGADDEIALRRSNEAFAALELHYHVLAGNHPTRSCSSHPRGRRLDLTTSLFGRSVGLPFFTAPAAGNRMFHCEGEVAVATVAREFGMMYALSSFSTSTFDEIAAAHDSSPSPPTEHPFREASSQQLRLPRAFQLYVWRDRAFVREILARARAAGFESLILTADLSWFGNREADLRNGFTVPPDYSFRQCAGAAAAPAWTWDWLTHPPYSYALVDQDVSADSIAAYVNAQIEPAFDWEDATWLCSEWGGPVALKGVVRPDDAKRALQAGFSTVWVSNHGGRQLETAVPPIDVLPSIRDAVGPDAQLILDGGVRRGVDIAKALALGADGVAIGKPYLYGLAAGGRVGVHKVVRLLCDELERAMGLLGVGSVAELKEKGPTLVRPRRS